MFSARATAAAQRGFLEALSPGSAFRCQTGFEPRIILADEVAATTRAASAMASESKSPVSSAKRAKSGDSSPEGTPALILEKTPAAYERSSSAKQPSASFVKVAETFS